ncbi:c6 zinc finger domain-containing protein [Dactylonectria macrodidyma]|uniref:C6 zinc finger domain-containing protein n=1 Tax=Dactylonectria macrodidyma TaxID=307937 RepID=A0A9P9DYX5_9HYPO|nr:c6 zinc finger domain-containing protein [Dactylonectria macrodidyma]
MPLQSPDESSPSLKQTLRSRHLSRHRPSCLPCRERKVKCSKETPCSTCIKRGHPDLCTYEDPLSRQSQRSHRPSPRRSPTAPQNAQHEQRGDEIGPPDLYGGQNSAENYSRREGSTQGSQGNTGPSEQLTNPSLLDDSSLVTITRPHSAATTDNPDLTIAFQAGILPLLGANSGEQVSDTSPDLGATIYHSFPDDHLLLELFELYRSRVHPFHAITYNLDEIEHKLCVFIKDRQSGASGNPPRPLQDSHWLCLLHAILASGAQFSDFSLQRRSEVSQNHIKLAFESLRSTDYLAQPSAFTLQTLLLLGSALQNDMKPQAAWVLGGTTVRLAQCLGVHKPPGRRSQSLISAREASLLRMAIVWQDSLLSLAFDRSPGSYDMDHKADLESLDLTTNNGGLGYRAAMNWLCHTSLQYLSHKSTLESTSDPKSLFHDMGLIESALSAHLMDRSSCKSIRQVQEFYALSLHKNFVVATLCRPFVSIIRPPSVESTENTSVLGHFQEALRRSATAYVRLWHVAGYARRSWASIHNGLSSVLLLSLMKATRNSTDTRELQCELINSLVEADANSESVGGPASTAHQLSVTHKKALDALQRLKFLSDNDKNSEITRDISGDLTNINPLPTEMDISSILDDSTRLE